MLTYNMNCSLLFMKNVIQPKIWSILLVMKIVQFFQFTCFLLSSEHDHDTTLSAGKTLEKKLC